MLILFNNKYPHLMVLFNKIKEIVNFLHYFTISYTLLTIIASFYVESLIRTH